MVNKPSSLRLAAVCCCGGLLLFHAYYYCYAGFSEWGLTAPVADRLAKALARMGVLSGRDISKIAILVLLGTSQIGVAVGGVMPKWPQVLRGLACALLVYFGSDLLLYLTGDPAALSSMYLLAMGAGLVLAYRSLRPLTGWISVRVGEGIFNRFSESFPQEERHLPAPFGLHLEGSYRFRNQTRHCVINLVNIMRGTLVLGNPGSGKTRYIFRPLIRQSLELGMAAFIYDLKYPDLSEFVWYWLERQGKGALAFFSFNFEDLSHSHRCNPLKAEGIVDVSDAAEYARTILLAVNKQWVHRQGDFFVESAVNLLTAGIWFLRCHGEGRFCTLPHLIELIQHEHSELLQILMSQSECRSLVGSMKSAYMEGATDQLQGQIDSARVPLAALASPSFYYLLSGDDFSLDINNPVAPKVVCIGSNPQKSLVYGVAVSLLMNRMLKEINRRGGAPCHVVADEFASITVLGMAETLATARSNRVAVTLGIQDLTQLRAIYGRDRADALFNLPGNLICGQVSGDSARLVSERFGRTLQEKSTVSNNSRDSQISQSQQLEPVLPPSKIATLSSGEFVGVVADSPGRPLSLKAFHAQVLLDKEVREYEVLPKSKLPEVRQVSEKEVQANFKRIREEVDDIVSYRMATLAGSVGSQGGIPKKRRGGKRKRIVR